MASHTQSIDTAATHSTTRYGSAYFLLISVRRKTAVAGEYGSSASLSKQAAECACGMLTFDSTDPKIVASRSVQSPDSHSGSSTPL